MKKIILSLIIVVATILTVTAQNIKYVTIENHEGLTKYTKSYQQSIIVAEKFGLLIYQHQNTNRLMTYDEARKFERNTDYVQVTVKVKEGWIFKFKGNDAVALYLPNKKKWYSAKEFCKQFNKDHYQSFYLGSGFNSTNDKESWFGSEDAKTILYWTLGTVFVILVLSALIMIFNPWGLGKKITSKLDSIKWPKIKKAPDSKENIA